MGGVVFGGRVWEVEPSIDLDILGSVQGMDLRLHMAQIEEGEHMLVSVNGLPYPQRGVRPQTARVCVSRILHVNCQPCLRHLLRTHSCTKQTNHI